MRNRVLTAVTIALLPLWIGSCMTAKPPEGIAVSFEDAMRELMKGIDVFKEEAQDDGPKVGLAPTELDLTLNIGVVDIDSISTQVSSGLATGVVTELVAPTIAITPSSSRTRTNSNTITIKFRNIFYDQDGKPYTVSSGGEPDGLIRLIPEDAGILVPQ